MRKSIFNSKSKGFTLIELVIVLAIAGLIFVIVFLAVGAAQAARRDTARKDAQNQLVAAVNQYASNNTGNLPSAGWCGASGGGTAPATPSSYWSPGAEPAGSTYACVATAIAASATSPIAQVYFAPGSTCAAGGGVSPPVANSRQFAVQMILERGGVVCAQNL
jgi:prepilin-type N-terminal cleavage/methylation domain-containing protein